MTSEYDWLVSNDLIIARELASVHGGLWFRVVGLWFQVSGHQSEADGPQVFAYGAFKGAFNSGPASGWKVVIYCCAEA